MSRRRVHTSAQSTVVAGWTEVWSRTADGLACERVPLRLPRITARFEDGHYRLRERKPLVLPPSEVDD